MSKAILPAESAVIFETQSVRKTQWTFGDDMPSSLHVYSRLGVSFPILALSSKADAELKITWRVNSRGKHLPYTLFCHQPVEYDRQLEGTAELVSTFAW